jgi:hypothetical protein
MLAQVGTSYSADTREVAAAELRAMLFAPRLYQFVRCEEKFLLMNWAQGTATEAVGRPAEAMGGGGRAMRMFTPCRGPNQTKTQPSAASAAVCYRPLGGAQE